MQTYLVNKKQALATITVTFLVLSMFLSVPLVAADYSWAVTVEAEDNTATHTSNYNISILTADPAEFATLN